MKEMFDSPPPLKLGHLSISDSSSALIVAELSCNHRQNLSIALDSVRAIKRAGADAIKVQTFTADSMTLEENTGDFLISGGTPWDGRSLFDLYKAASLPWEWHARIKELAEALGLLFFSSPFDVRSLNLLDELGVPCFKIASFELVDIPFIEVVAQKGKPMIMSTGIASEEEVSAAVSACHQVGNRNIILLKCTSAYPTPFGEANLRNIPWLRERYGTHVGLSDHTLGATTAIVATSLGARLIEKHFILDKALGGPDATFSMDEREFSDMVRAVREAESSLGATEYVLTPTACESRRFGRSLYVTEPMVKGEIFSGTNVRSIRPGSGLPPCEISKILGRRATRDIARGEPLSWSLVEES
jgi:pseudaminic acid synthase